MPKLLQPGSIDFASIVLPGDTIMWGQANAEPVPLTQALVAQRHRIGQFRVFLGAGATDTCKPEHADCIDFVSYCGTGTNRALARAGALDVLPCHYSQFPQMIRSGALKVDVLLLQLAPPDEEGRYSLSIAHEYLIPALDTARIIVAEINDQAPWTYGERYLRDDDLDFTLPTSRAPLENAPGKAGDIELAIAGHVADWIEDGATLQFGLGAIPEAVLARLSDRRDLGVHSGTIGDKVADLMDAGVINNTRKSVDRGLTVAGVMMGSRRIHDFAHRNSAVQFRSTSYTHDPDVLAHIDRFVALNSALEVDLSGQINAEIAGGGYVGAVGGALDFLRAARRAKGGLPVVALPSTTGKGASRIVSTLSGPVSTPRSDAGIIVTEYGVADLRGLTLTQRRERLLAIAHPDYRAVLEHSTSGAA
ncbi:acetyl-CoA hydrolase/transferase C-terminal domain-containing protein [Paraburkholderia sp. BL10I2N1]|uniref:acetyl-CoA hydrolase/transferase family protein n=1 Tax=Paraburkholderia sp. BL10I2N1 TaxID=1938796 RepID=UPI0010613FC6|nr:acetyl-CoA hydrolase/transferase C-terminal domain-containing protein [Paraburkholderia sp. BL10I2N1]TDN59205.1 acetyl-CoA hydrolase [Paraburkholderia sp. BL10I2N1]